MTLCRSKFIHHLRIFFKLLLLYSVLTSEFLERLMLGRVRRHHRVVRMLGVATDQVLASGGRVMQVTQTANGHQARDGGGDADGRAGVVEAVVAVEMLCARGAAAAINRGATGAATAQGCAGGGGALRRSRRASSVCCSCAHQILQA